jgi:hypothetical protein
VLAIVAVEGGVMAVAGGGVGRWLLVTSRWGDKDFERRGRRGDDFELGSCGNAGNESLYVDPWCCQLHFVEILEEKILRMSSSFDL